MQRWPARTFLLELKIAGQNSAAVNCSSFSASLRVGFVYVSTFFFFTEHFPYLLTRLPLYLRTRTSVYI